MRGHEKEAWTALFDRVHVREVGPSSFSIHGNLDYFDGMEQGA